MRLIHTNLDFNIMNSNLFLRIGFIAIFFIAVSFSNDSGKKLPSVDIKTLNGVTFNTSQIENDGAPIVLSFWATWCKPCIQELTTIADVYEDWQDETDVKLVAISIDNTRNSHKVLPMINSKAWDYEVYLDENGEFKRAMGVNMVPHTFILDGDKNIVWQHTSFTEGGELEMFEVIKKVANGEEIDE